MNVKVFPERGGRRLLFDSNWKEESTLKMRSLDGAEREGCGTAAGLPILPE
jgi:hypothetical protein